MKKLLSFLPLVVCTIGCGAAPEETDEVAVPPVPVENGRAAPLENGSLAVSPSGKWALSLNAGAKEVSIVSLDDEPELVTFPLLERELPGRVLLDDETGYVLLRGTGEVLQLNLAEGEVSGRFAVCGSPQGADLSDGQLTVACRGGALVTLTHEGQELRRLQLDVDLRDVVVQSSRTIVSRFQSAELLVVDVDGTVVRRLKPAAPRGTRVGVAWRLLQRVDGKLILAHQFNHLSTLGENRRVYGEGSLCGSVVSPVISVIDLDDDSDPFEREGPSGPSRRFRELFSDPSHRFTRAQLVLRGGGTTDLSVLGTRLAVALPGLALGRRLQPEDSLQPGLDLRGLEPPDVVQADRILEVRLRCEPHNVDPNGARLSPVALALRHEVPIGVAHVPEGDALFSGRTLVQTMYPPALRVLGTERVFELGESSLEDVGQTLFQAVVGAGVACASCHPVGRADSHIWRFPSGLRTTQSLEGGVSHLGAFHWDGELRTFEELVDEVFVSRMGFGHEVNLRGKQAFRDFVDRIPAPTWTRTLDEETVREGRDLFASAETQCSECHSGPYLTDNVLHDVGTGASYVTPSLRGVGLRAPLMHDGCAEDLEARFGLCGGGDHHGKTSHLNEDEIAQLVEYMKSL